MEKINLSDLLEPEHMDPVKRIALIRIVDDDGGVRESYKFLIESEGWRVKTYPSAEAFLEEDDPTVPGCGVFDVRMTGITGMELHQKLIELANRLPVIFVSAHGDIEMAVKAMRRGAVDFLTKPVVDEKLLSSIDRAVARSCEEAAEAETVRELAGLWQALSPPRVPGRAARRRGPHHEGRLRRTRHRRAHRTGPRRPRLLEARR